MDCILNFKSMNESHSLTHEFLFSKWLSSSLKILDKTRLLKASENGAE